MGCTSTTVTLLVFNGLFVSAEKTLATSRALTGMSRHKFLLAVYLLPLEVVVIPAPSTARMHVMQITVCFLLCMAGYISLRNSWKIQYFGFAVGT